MAQKKHNIIGVRYYVELLPILGPLQEGERYELIMSENVVRTMDDHPPFRANGVWYMRVFDGPETKEDLGKLVATVDKNHRWWYPLTWLGSEHVQNLTQQFVSLQ